MSIVWQGRGAKVEAQRIHGTRDAGKLAQGARSNGSRWATASSGSGVPSLAIYPVRLGVNGPRPVSSG